MTSSHDAKDPKCRCDRCVTRDALIVGGVLIAGALSLLVVDASARAAIVQALAEALPPRVLEPPPVIVDAEPASSATLAELVTVGEPSISDGLFWRFGGWRRWFGLADPTWPQPDA